MSKRKLIRIIGPGIHGAPTEGNPTGEYPVGHEFETEADLPAGWKGRAVIVGDEPAEGSELIVNEDDDSDLGKVRRELIAKAQEHIDGLKAQHETAITALTNRAEKAEGELAEALKSIDGLKAQLAVFDHDGNGNAGGAAAPAGEAASAGDIVAAIGLLDAKNDAHWTGAGLPAVAAVAELAGKTVTREAIEAAAPDAKRPTE